MDTPAIIILSIVGFAVGLIIQYLIIKGAVLDALKKQDLSSAQLKRTNELLEVITNSVGTEEELKKLFLKKRKQEYLKKREIISSNSYGEFLKQKLSELEKEYEDVANL